MTTKTLFKHDDRTGEVIINRKQDCTDIIKKNKHLYNGVSTKGKKFKGNWHMVADIPEVLVERWMKEHKFNFYGKTERDNKIRKMLLNSRDNRFVRTMPGAI